MKFFAIVALCIVGCYAAPNYGGYGVTPEIKIVSHEAPIMKVAAPAYHSAPAYTAVKSYAPAPILEVKKPVIPIVRFNLKDDNYGTFNFDSLSGDGTKIVEQGNLKNLGDPEGPVSVMSGSYSFISDDGKTYTVNWVADENGFRASGDHLPVPPPIPEEILKSLSTISSSSSLDDGQYHEMDHIEAPLVKLSGYHGYSAPAVVSAAKSSAMSGSYSFVADDHKTYTVNWVADENGFRATGDHLPTPPPVPQDMVKSLAPVAAPAPILRSDGFSVDTPNIHISSH